MPELHIIQTGRAMRRTCPFLLGALLIALICLGGGPQHLDRLLAPTTAWIAGWLPSELVTRLANRVTSDVYEP